MQATLTKPTPSAEATAGQAGEWKPLIDLKDDLGCSYDHLNRLRRDGFLSCRKSYRGYESTRSLVEEAWWRRAEADLERRELTPSNPKAAARQSRENRAHAAAQAMGLTIKK